jgi:hypothetical protein
LQTSLPSPRHIDALLEHYRHSDNKKFCNDLKWSKLPKMSERPLKTLQFFETSKLNTRGSILFTRSNHAAIAVVVVRLGEDSHIVLI